LQIWQKKSKTNFYGTNKLQVNQRQRQRRMLAEASQWSHSLYAMSNSTAEEWAGGRSRATIKWLIPAWRSANAEGFRRQHFHLEDLCKLSNMALNHRW